MARDLIDSDESTRVFLRAAEDRLGLPLRRLLLEGPEDALQATQHAQPAILFHSLTLHRHLAAAGLTPAAVAGHSLGEFAGLVAAGGLEPLDALAAVAARGQAMSSAAPSGTGMAAVLGLDDALVERLCWESSGGVVPANYNAPGQVVISGSAAALDAIAPKLDAAGARRVIRLPVSAAFHSPQMARAAGLFAADWQRVPLRPLQLPQVFNADAAVHRDPVEVRELMVRQLTGPVRWTACVRRLSELGADTFVEVGPKRTLTGLVKKVLPDATVRNVEDGTSLREFLAAPPRAR